MPVALRSSARRRCARALLLTLLLALPACSAAPQVPARLTGQPVAARAAVAPLARQQPCAGAFVAHTLDAGIDVAGDVPHLYDSNGSGVAAGDIDGDGRIDLAFANLDGPDRILWNQGGMHFRAEPLDDTSSRAVAIVDVDGDGLLDVVFTHRAAGITLWRNQGGGRLAHAPLPGILAPAYSMAWGDVAGDTAIDLVTGAYDAELALRQNSGVSAAGGGVYVYERRGAELVGRQLAPHAQALAIGLPDIDGDGRPDIWVGNDFTMRDQVWLRSGGGWAPASPFAATSESTMSIDQGDVDNDGSPELFSTDMKPYDRATENVARWLPVMARMPRLSDQSDPQVMENVLQVRDSSGVWRNDAYARRADATGWSWSGKFGDLDGDGFLDLYVVNGMAAAELFGHLPGAELVERNQALRNDGSGGFRPAPEWGLGSPLGGRGMTMADLDGDGRLDIVVNNLRAPAQLFENRLCGADGLEVELRWPGSGNTRALGARLALWTSAGTFYRDVRATSGYLSGDAPLVHFGVPSGARIDRLEVRWPDGRLTTVPAPPVHTLVTLTR